MKEVEIEQTLVSRTDYRSLSGRNAKTQMLKKILPTLVSLVALGILLAFGWRARYVLLGLSGLVLVAIAIWASLAWMISPKENWRWSEKTQVYLSCALLVAALWLLPALMGERSHRLHGDYSQAQINLAPGNAVLVFVGIAIVLLCAP